MILKFPLLVAFAILLYATLKDDASITDLGLAFMSGCIVTAACCAIFEHRRKPEQDRRIAELVRREKERTR